MNLDMRQYSFIQKFYNERFLTALDKVQFIRVHSIAGAFIAINLVQDGLFLKIVERAAYFTSRLRATFNRRCMS